MSQDKITKKEIYEELWKGRDFEINHLWQRSIFLATFMVGITTGYGTILMKMVFPEDVSQLCKTFLQHLLATGLCYLGVIVSILWAMMAKGSKFLQERYEASISWCMGSSDIAEEIPSDFPYHGNLKQLDEDRCCDNIFSPQPAHYSVSNINWVIGIIGICCWALLFMLHCGKFLQQVWTNLNSIQIVLGCTGIFFVVAPISLLILH